MVLSLHAETYDMKGPLRRNDPFDQDILDSIFPCDRLIDVGPGIRPFDNFEARVHLCIEPHGEYVTVLSDRGYPVIQAEALITLPFLRNFETVLFIDVLEHMSKADGILCLSFAKVIATKQIVVFTPLGFMKQEQIADEPDAWGYNGWAWQTHRSGWTPDEFQGWDISVGRNYHGSHSAFAAVLNK